jgi:hypothetical protein
LNEQQQSLLEFLQEGERMFPVYTFNSAVAVLLEMFDEALDNGLPERALYIIETLASNHGVKFVSV